MKTSNRLARLMLLLGLAAAATAHGFTLVSDEEFRQESAFAATTRSYASKAIEPPGAPRIEVISPEVSGVVKPPVRIQVKFVAEQDSEINPATFKVYYGMFRLDLTERILKQASVTKAGMQLDNADVPAGNHRLFLQIKDGLQRQTEKEIRIKLE